MKIEANIFGLPVVRPPPAERKSCSVNALHAVRKASREVGKFPGLAVFSVVG
jgi:hypothetical protein